MAWTCRLCRQPLTVDGTVDNLVDPQGRHLCPTPRPESLWGHQWRQIGIDPLALSEHDKHCRCGLPHVHIPI